MLSPTQEPSLEYWMLLFGSLRPALVGLSSPDDAVYHINLSVLVPTCKDSGSVRIPMRSFQISIIIHKGTVQELGKTTNIIVTNPASCICNYGTAESLMMIICIRTFTRNNPVIVKQTVNELGGYTSKDRTTVGTVFRFNFIVNKLATDKFYGIIKKGCSTSRRWVLDIN